MNSLDILKKLKSITPDRFYSDRSRAMILGAEQPRRVSIWRIAVESLEAGSAMVLVGLFFVLIFGGFSGFKILNISNLNPTNLKAEADAIDMQIQLANLNYENFAAVVAKKKEAAQPSLMSAAQTETSSSTTAANFAAGEATTTPTLIGIDAALRILSE